MKRSSQSRFPELPVEVWLFIVSFVRSDWPSLLNFSLLCRASHDLANSSIWHSTSLVLPDDTTLKIQARCDFFGGPGASRISFVRSCRIWSRPRGCELKRKALKIIWNGVASILISFLNLRHLDLDGSEGHLDLLVDALVALNYKPLLHCFALRSKSTTPLLNFITSLPSVDVLRIYSSVHQSTARYPPFRVYTGSAEFAIGAIPGSSVSCVEILDGNGVYPREDFDPINMTQRLSSSFSRSATSIRHLRLPVHWKGPQMLSILAPSLPSLRKLDVVYIDHRMASAATLNNIFASLILFPELEEVSFRPAPAYLRFPFKYDYLISKFGDGPSLWKDVSFGPMLRKLFVVSWLAVRSGLEVQGYTEYIKGDDGSWTVPAATGYVDDLPDAFATPFDYRRKEIPTS